MLRNDVYPYCSESDSAWISRLDFPEDRYVIYTAQAFATGRYTGNQPNTMGLHSRGSGWTPLNEFYKLPEAPKPVIEGEVEDEEPSEEEVVIIEKDTPELTQKQTVFVDSLLLNECGLELAFEGTRFYDIMRFAYRQPNPGQFLADKVYARRGKVNSSVMRSEIKKDLTDQRNWFLDWNGQIGIGF